MQKAPIPENEKERMEAVHQTAIFIDLADRAEKELNK